jgi:hypothetical protein
MLRNTHRLALIHERLAYLLAEPFGLAIADCPINLPAMNKMMQYHSARSGDQGLRWLRQRISDAARKSTPPLRPGSGCVRLRAPLRTGSTVMAETIASPFLGVKASEPLTYHGHIELTGDGGQQGACGWATSIASMTGLPLARTSNTRSPGGDRFGKVSVHGKPLPPRARRAAKSPAR